MLSFDDVLHWDPSAIHKALGGAIKRGDTLTTLQGNLQTIQTSVHEDWVGEAGQAFQHDMQKVRQDIAADGQKSQRVAAALARAEEDVSGFRADAQWIQAAAKANDWTITTDWKIDVGQTEVGRSLAERLVLAKMQQLLQGELDKLQADANQADQELAAAMRAAAGEAQPSATGHQRPASATTAHPAPAATAQPAPAATAQPASTTTAQPASSATAQPAQPHQLISATRMPTGPVDAKRAIPLSAVAYGGMGQWASGQQAMRGYINQALDAEGITNATARANWMKGMLTLVGRESSYNGKSASAQVNTWDSNARASTHKAADGYGNDDSRGAAQCIPTTFATDHQPGTSDSIYNPVANVAADMNHLMSTYHVSRDGSNLAANVAQTNPDAAPHGQ